MLLPYMDKLGIEVGCDEAGRGPLAGPVFAAAVIWPKNLKAPEIDDSKKLSEKKRFILRDYIEENALAYSIAMVDENEIDKINILKASIKAMHLALDKIDIKFDRILVDGNRFYDYNSVEHHLIIKGDGKFTSIAAASILAKTYRDEFMIKLDEEYPCYLWKNNKGYPTKHHINSIISIGITKYHRKTFCKNVFERARLKKENK